MSGNTTQLAIAAGQAEWWFAGGLGGAVLLFVGGVAGASLLRRRVRRRPVACMMACVTALLLLACLLVAAGQDYPAVAVAAVAMGAENVVFEADGKPRIGLTYMTGTLVRAGEKLATALAGGPRWAWMEDLLMWAALLAGGFTGALAFRAAGLGALWAAAAAAAGLTAAAWRLRDRATCAAPSGSAPRAGRG